jgi:hypothetical protein
MKFNKARTRSNISFEHNWIENVHFRWNISQFAYVVNDHLSSLVSEAIIWFRKAENWFETWEARSDRFADETEGRDVPNENNHRARLKKRLRKIVVNFGMCQVNSFFQAYLVVRSFPENKQKPAPTRVEASYEANSARRCMHYDWIGWTLSEKLTPRISLLKWERWWSGFRVSVEISVSDYFVQNSPIPGYRPCHIADHPTLSAGFPSA